MGEQTTYSLSEAIEESTAGHRLQYLEQREFQAVLDAPIPAKERAGLFAQMARFNALYMVAKAGSGHLGSSFSSLDIVAWLYTQVLEPGDRYFSSKGHDSPGLYAVQAALGILPFEKIHSLRQLGGLPGHPDVGTPGAFTNTGSLGMGVSKAKGFLFADKLLGKTGRVYVLTGDGELQEGQFWESLISAARDRSGKLTVIIDHNKIQSDTFVAKTSDLGELEAKLKAFGWSTHRCNGHDYDALERLLSAPDDLGRPKVVIADTVKGRGVSFMEHTAMPDDEIFYKFHSGAPNQDDYLRAATELLNDVRDRSVRLGINSPRSQEVGIQPITIPPNHERMIPAYTQAILKEARAKSKLIALDADLVLDTGLIPFMREFPERFVECGIAEQDMVSQAGTMALSGLLPVVHSFACFLTTRPAEQIYNNCTEGTKIIYVGSLAGLLPAGPGHSHQSVRDVTAMSAMPGVTILEPACAEQVEQALSWAVNTNPGSTYLRLTSIPYEKRPELAHLEPIREGCGHVIASGPDLCVIVAGPILATQALKAAELLAKEGLRIQVISTPWLNRIDLEWYKHNLAGDNTPLVTLENQYSELGFGAWLIGQLAVGGVLQGRRATIMGITNVPVSGRNEQVLRHHGLDSESLAATFTKLVQQR